MLQKLNTVRDLKDPLKQFVSTWQFGNVPGVTLPQNIELRAITYGFPTLNGDTTEVTWAGFKRVYAGKQTRQGSWSVKFVEVWDAKIVEAFKRWVNRYHEYIDGKIRLANDYWSTVNVKILDPEVYDTSEDIAEYSLKLYDVYPTEISVGQIDASSSDPIEIEVTFNYNFFLLGNEIKKVSGTNE